MHQPMKSNPFISIVMPARNAAGSIAGAIDSICLSQTADWELVVCDDCSADATARIVADYAARDARIRLIHSDYSRGSAYYPRKLAIEAARGSWILELDADDSFGKGYLDTILSTIESAHPDMIIQRLRRQGFGTADGDDEAIPSDETLSYLLSGPHPGRELMKFTLDKWRLPLYLIARKELFTKAYEEGDEPEAMNADEVFSRRILLGAKRVVYCGAEYFYMYNPDSVTHAVTPRRFDVMQTSRRLMRIVGKEFGHQSMEYSLAAHSCYCTHLDCLTLLDRVPHTAGRSNCRRKVKEGFNSPEWRQARRHVRGLIKWLSYLPFPMLQTALRFKRKVSHD